MYWRILHTFAFATDDKGFVVKSANLTVEYFWGLMALIWNPLLLSGWGSDVEFTKQIVKQPLKEGEALFLRQVKFEEGKSDIVIFAKLLFYLLLSDMKMNF